MCISLTVTGTEIALIGAEVICHSGVMLMQQ